MAKRRDPGARFWFGYLMLVLAFVGSFVCLPIIYAVLDRVIWTSDEMPLGDALGVFFLTIVISFTVLSWIGFRLRRLMFDPVELSPPELRRELGAAVLLTAVLVAFFVGAASIFS